MNKYEWGKWWEIYLIFQGNQGLILLMSHNIGMIQEWLGISSLRKPENMYIMYVIFVNITKPLHVVLFLSWIK